jgi:hypothetical protein
VRFSKSMLEEIVPSHVALDFDSRRPADHNGAPRPLGSTVLLLTSNSGVSIRPSNIICTCAESSPGATCRYPRRRTIHSTVGGGTSHGFRRGLASNLNRLGVDDSVIQRILRHSTVATTQNHYIKTGSPDAVAAMRQLSNALLCSTCAPESEIAPQGAVQ